MTAENKQGQGRLQLDRVLFMLLDLGTTNHSHAGEDRMVPETGRECTWTQCPAPDGQASDGGLRQSFHLQRTQHPSPRAAHHHSSSNLLTGPFTGQTSPCHPSLQPPGGQGGGQPASECTLTSACSLFIWFPEGPGWATRLPQ